MNNSDQDFKCVLCDSTFPTKEDLQVHFRKHADPNFKQKKGREHCETEGSVEKTKVQIEMVECDVCPEMFSSISKAITHKHKVHPDHDTKYFCEWCGKLFTMKYLYNKHLKSAHSNTEMNEDHKCFHCDTCNVDFIHSAMVYHNKFYHRQEELPTIGHSKKLKMVTQETVQIYYCPFCGEEFDNKVNLHKHMSDEHSDENQSPEEVLRCPLCDAIFYHLDAYEVHLTYHSTEDLYAERNQLIEETTDFSLETVQPQREKIENAVDAQDQLPSAMGIEDLLEFTMDDGTVKKKSKKHKKHKKAKHAAITLDEFLNMNKDVFGEGIDFEGVEEVPTRAITKRLKPNKPTKVVSDIAKLKKQGIVVKKQTNLAKPIPVNKVMPKQAVNPLNKEMPTQMTKLSSTDDVLSKLLNQGSQIKIVKKSNQDEETQNGTKQSVTEQKDMDNRVTDKICSDSVENKLNDDIPEAEETVNNESIKAQCATTPLSPIQNSDKDLKSLVEITNTDKNADESQCSEKPETFVGGVAASKNNTNVPIRNSNVVSNSEEKEYKTPICGEIDKDVSNDEGNTNKTNEKPLNALKHLSHLITIKPVNQPQKSVTHNKDLDNNSHDSSPTPIKNNSPKETSVKSPYVKNLSEITIKTNPQNKLEEAVNYSDPETDCSDAEQNPDESLENKNVAKIAHVIKNPHLNVDTKHSPNAKSQESPKINPNNNNKSNTPSVKQFKIQTPKSSPSIIKPPPIPKTSTKEHNEEPEIFSIDDSDSDEGNTKKCNSTSKHTAVKEPRPMDVLKNISKNITIKSNKVEQVNQPAKGKLDSDDDFDDDENNVLIPCKSTNNFNSQQKNQNAGAVHNVLKFLGKNITVKSRNSSPSQSAQSQDYNSRDSQVNDGCIDNDPKSPRVKITEIENPSDDEFPDDPDDDDIPQKKTKIKVQHPDDSHSDHDDFTDDDFDAEADLESQIKTTTLQKPNNTPKSKNVPSNQVRTTCKESAVNRSQNKDKSENSKSSELAKSLGDQISIKQIKKPESKNPERVVRGVAVPVSNQALLNRRVATSSDRLDTSNREVKTVKTYRTQTETVIEEITTTVTKTVKTVNQTMKQEVRNASHSGSGALPLKVRGMNPGAVPKNFQGVKVRQAATIPPNMRPKIRGTPPQVMRPAICAPPPGPRPAAGAPRPSDQLVPVRPAAGPPGPRARPPNATKVRPSASGPGPQRPRAGPAIKVSPGAVVSSSPKRPAESPGHFSCFKKPKESLIPVADFPEAGRSDEPARFSSAVHMTKSNFSSTTRTVKGNSVVTATTMKSEASASSRQLSKLQGVVGLSVVKTSQAKQSHVEERTEVSATRRDTLEAIQKLQNQGLLVKKPRMQVNEDSDHSDPHSDDMGHVSDEFDED